MGAGGSAQKYVSTADHGTPTPGTPSREGSGTVPTTWSQAEWSREAAAPHARPGPLPLGARTSPGGGGSRTSSASSSRTASSGAEGEGAGGYYDLSDPCPPTHTAGRGEQGRRDERD